MDVLQFANKCNINFSSSKAFSDVQNRKNISSRYSSSCWLFSKAAISNLKIRQIIRHRGFMGSLPEFIELPAEVIHVWAAHPCNNYEEVSSIYLGVKIYRSSHLTVNWIYTNRIKCIHLYLLFMFDYLSLVKKLWKRARCISNSIWLAEVEIWVHIGS